MSLCHLCEREVVHTTRHHLLPRSRGGKHTPTVDLCQPCHNTIHNTFSNKELSKKYTSIEALRQAEALQTYLEWIKDKTIEKLTFRKRKR